MDMILIRLYIEITRLCVCVYITSDFDNAMPCYVLQKVAALAILLVGLFTSKAHDTHSSELTEGWSTIQTLSKSSHNSSKPSAVDNKSVVVNWSLICKDLCG